MNNALFFANREVVLIEAPVVDIDAIYPNTISISWNEPISVHGVSEYKIYVNNLLHATTSELYYHASQIDADTLHSIKVKAIDVLDNESGFSNTVTATTLENTYAQTYSIEYEAMLDYAILNNISIPSLSQRTIDNQMILNLKTESIWSELDTLWYFKANYTESPVFASNFYRLNWKDATNHLLYLHNNEPDFVTSSGFRGLGATQIMTDFIPSIDAVQMTKLNASISIGLFEMTPFVNRFYFGGRIANNAAQISFFNHANNAAFMLVNRPPSYQFAIPQSDLNGHFQSDVVNDSAKVFRNSVEIVDRTVSDGGGGLAARELTILGFNNNGSIGGARDMGVKYIALGDTLRTKQNEFYEILNQLY